MVFKVINPKLGLFGEWVKMSIRRHFGALIKTRERDVWGTR